MMMVSVIFLNQVQKQRLIEAGVGINCLTEATLKEYLTFSEYNQIMEDSWFLRQPGRILNRFGFDAHYCGETKYCSKQLHNSVPENGVIFNAVCPDRNSIVLWLEDKPEINTYDMIKVSLLAITLAIANIMPFEEVKRTIQFKNLFLQKNV